MNMKRFFLLWIGFLIILGFAVPVNAQSDDYAVHLRRNFGYGGGTNIRGTFTISLLGEEENVETVTFLIDGEPMVTVTEAPFNFKFQTDDYGFGMHRLSARVILENEQVVETPAIQYNFVSPSTEREQVLTIVGGVVGAIIVALLLVAGLQSLFIKGNKTSAHEPGSPRNYGLLGGTICPKCRRPFPRHIWGMNLVVGRLDRCENCGKWVMTIRATPTALRLAEEAELEAQKRDQELTIEKPELKNDLDETKYFDGI